MYRDARGTWGRGDALEDGRGALEDARRSRRSRAGPGGYKEALGDVRRPSRTRGHPEERQQVLGDVGDPGGQ